MIASYSDSHERALRYLLEPPRTTDVSPGSYGWSVGGAILVFDTQAGWRLIVDEGDVEDLRLADAVRLLGPEVGACAARQMVAAASADPARLSDRVEEIAAGMEALQSVREAATAAHVHHAARIARSRAALFADDVEQDHVDVTFDYLDRRAECASPGRWVVREREDDEDPILLRFWTHPEPGDVAGWKISRTSEEGNAHRWRPVDMTVACETVGPLHAGEIAVATRRLACVTETQTDRMENELTSAAYVLCRRMDALVREHARRAQVLSVPVMTPQ